VTEPNRERAASALEEGRAYAELSTVAVTLLSGADARRFLGDLATTDVATLRPHGSRPSLLLTPTGRILASFHVLGLDGPDLLLVQGADQPAPIADLLAPYVLSSDVAIVASDARLLAVPGGDGSPPWADGVWRPSVLGDGYDLLLDGGEDALRSARERLEVDGLEPATPEAVEARRVRRGDPRFPVDLDPDSLPAEAGWDGPPVTDRGKGCFLGQEAVAKVANLGHPTRRVLAVRAETALEAGEPVVADGGPVGVVTSADGRLGIARVRWDARAAPLSRGSGERLDRR
jgi:folate-binding protein YgfZ